MPITKSAIKSARQNITRRERRQPHKTRLKSAMRSFTDLVKAGKKEEAAKMFPLVQKIIDTASKKMIIHPRNASRKKSRLSKLLK